MIVVPVLKGTPIGPFATTLVAMGSPSGTNDGATREQHAWPMHWPRRPLWAGAGGALGGVMTHRHARCAAQFAVVTKIAVLAATQMWALAASRIASG